MIENIGIAWLKPHPDNPRKDLGDLSELAESIKANGILQNLTVVPSSDGYRVIIGHRRLAAGKLAGLTQFPCTVSDMDHKQQVATMLTENMQRSDLTIWEQAQGIQMLLDFGETVGDVARQTGFSWTTIQRRVKLLELDADKFKKSIERGATLQDYAELDKIQDIDLKNSVLEKIGTSDFQWKLKGAIDQQKNEKQKAALIEKLKTFATQVESDDGMKLIRYLYGSPKDNNIPDDAGDKKYFFMVESYGIKLLEENSTISGQDNSAEMRRKQQFERRQQLEEVGTRAYQLRREFVKQYRFQKRHTNIIFEFAVRAFMETGSNYLRNQYLLELLEVEPGEGKITFSSFQDMFTASPEKVLFVTAYGNMESPNIKCYDWQGTYGRNEALVSVYELLERLGYPVSDEERAYIDGTHELYVREEGE